MIETIHNTNDAGPLTQVFPPGVAVPFNQIPVTVGTAFTQLDPTTFMFNRAGTYRVDYTFQTAAISPLGSVQVEVSGLPVGSPSTLSLAGSTLTGTVVFDAISFDVVRIVVGGLGINLAAGDSASITITQLSSD